MNKLRYLVLAAMVGLMLAMVFAVLWQLRLFDKTFDISIATGQEGGTYETLGRSLKDILKSNPPVNSVDIIQSHGSSENMKLVETRQVDFALIQSDETPSTNIQIVSPLYSEVLHVFIRADVAGSVLSVEDLSTLKTVSLGLEKSGTRKLALKFLEHFDIQISEYQFETNEADHLIEMFASKKLDAAFLLASPGAEHVDRLLSSGRVRLLSLGENKERNGRVDAFALLNPEVRASTIPRGLYGKTPMEPIQTLSVTALLVTHKSADQSLVKQITAEIFKNKSLLANTLPLILDSPYLTSHYPFAHHEGSEAYYLRNDPVFLVRYAEVISLFITLLFGFWSVVGVLFSGNKILKKERIDKYYKEVQKASVLTVEHRADTLRQIHKRAFTQLSAEKLDADESFSIFQRYLLSELAIAAKLEESTAAGKASSS